ncbi:hypothetical protein CDD83_5409 [Cordyceps sp. RAO-2017]|nr:hypothetical protein CDD83_5409 [Cordyceps sp. RAO-2017]
MACSGAGIVECDAGSSLGGISYICTYSLTSLFSAWLICTRIPLSALPEQAITYGHGRQWTRCRPHVKNENQSGGDATSIRSQFPFLVRKDAGPALGAPIGQFVAKKGGRRRGQGGRDGVLPDEGEFHRPLGPSTAVSGPRPNPSHDASVPAGRRCERDEQEEGGRAGEQSDDDVSAQQSSSSSVRRMEDAVPPPSSSSPPPHLTMSQCHAHFSRKGSRRRDKSLRLAVPDGRVSRTGQDDEREGQRKI